MSYPLENIFKEVAFLGYHLHWSRHELMTMSHLERHRWVKEVSDINERINKGT